MHHPVFGAVLPLLIALVIYTRRRGRASLPMLIATPAAMAGSALWAVIPDMPRLLGLQSLYRNMADSPWSNLFWFHYTLDAIELAWFDPYAPVFHAVFAGMVLLPVLMAWRELYCTEAERSAQAPDTPHGP